MKFCSRCKIKHNGDKYDTCNNCRSYNNWNKFLYEFADKHELTHEEARQGFRDAFMIKMNVVTGPGW